MKNKDFCPCTKKDCALRTNCKLCVAKHNMAKQIPHCLFPNNDGNRSLENFYFSLKQLYSEEIK